MKQFNNKPTQASLAMVEEEILGARSWFIGLSDQGHEGRYDLGTLKHDQLCSLLDGCGSIQQMMWTLKHGRGVSLMEQ